MPRVSVLMSVYNGEAFLDEAVRSILNQTYRDFEFLVIDDASRDESWRLLHAYKDPRLRLVRNEKNMGLAASLNRGLDMIDCEFVARMDADDISVHRRLEWQVRYLDDHPEVGVCGTWMKSFGVPEMAGTTRCPTGAECVTAFLLFANPISHPTVVMRKAWLDRHRLRYDPAFGRAEDLDLWLRSADHFPLDNIGRIGLYRRDHGESVTALHGETMDAQAGMLIARQLRKIGIDPDPETLNFHQRVGLGRRMRSVAEFDHAEAWLLRVKQAALRSGRYKEKGLEEALGRIWFRLCANSTPATAGIIRRYNRSELRPGYSPALPQWAVLFASTLWHHVFRKAAIRS